MRKSEVAYNRLKALVREVVSDESHILQRKWFTSNQLMNFIDDEKLSQRSISFQLKKIASQLEVLHHKTMNIKKIKEKRYVEENLFLILNHEDKTDIVYPYFVLEKRHPVPPPSPTLTPTHILRI